MAGEACVKRLQKEYRALCKEPLPNILARPSPNNILHWHYVLKGSEGTPFEGGYYHGNIHFQQEYPYKPPGITMITPNGRFMTKRKICLSMSDFHPESWNPMWSVSSILTGLLSFMLENSPTAGSVSTSDEQKCKLAKASLAFNLEDSKFKELFPEYVVEECNQQNNTQLVAGGSQEDKALLEKDDPMPREDAERAVFAKKKGRGQFQKPLPTWFFFCLVSMLGVLIALPLLQG